MRLADKVNDGECRKNSTKRHCRSEFHNEAISIGFLDETKSSKHRFCTPKQIRRTFLQVKLSKVCRLVCREFGSVNFVS